MDGSDIFFFQTQQNLDEKLTCDRCSDFRNNKIGVPPMEDREKRPGMEGILKYLLVPPFSPVIYKRQRLVGMVVTK